jgi:class 3 adenylate cyclase
MEGVPSVASRRLRSVGFVVVLATAAVCLIWLGQIAAAALVPLIGLLCIAIERRNRRARVLAQMITSGRLVEKLEVQRGAWGELIRAVNGLLQEQRVQQRLRAALPAPLPLEAVQALLDGQLATSGRPRIAAVLLASHTTHRLSQEGHRRKAALVAWQALAQAAQEAAQHHGALLQPCGAAIMLTFGAFEEQPAGELLRAALAAAESLERTWRGGGINAGGPLILSLASGPALTVALPGLGYCVLGTPVDQACQLQQLARSAQRYGLVCSESVYYALRHTAGTGWQPTEMRLPVSDQPSLVVYSLSAREAISPTQLG